MANQEDVTSGWLTTAEAAARLGVQPATLYAYVSRGMLRSFRAGGGRESRFEAGEVERVAARARRGGRAGALELVVDTELTALDPAGSLSYRGRDAAELSRTSAFEDVAEWLWTGNWPAGPATWEAPSRALRAAAAVAELVPSSAPPVDRLVAAVAVLAPLDPLRHDRRPEAVSACARRLLACLVDSLPSVRTEPAGPAPAVPLDIPGARPRPRALAARLWPRLCAPPPQAPQLRALNAALVLLADHELAASTLAARVAASTWADPYHVVLAGLGALDGPLHGRASDAAARLLASAGSDGPAEAVGATLRAGDLVPGFGHKVYTGPDPRAAALFDLIAEAWPASSAVRAASEVRDIVTAHGGPAPNIDFALAALATAAGMVSGAGEAIFALARIAGWVAHAIEEYPHRLRYRPRAVYVGARPLAGGRAARKVERVAE